MNRSKSPRQLRGISLSPIFPFLVRWILLSGVVGLLSGSASALFLVSLDFVTTTRESNVWLIAFLPVGGLLIGLLYHHLGREVEAGNNLLITEYHEPRKKIPFRMAPLVLVGTLLTHLFGGSAGREGTAVQMGGSLADQLTGPFKLQPSDRRFLLISGISGGFASVFGTPLAGAVFAIEVLVIGRLCYQALIPSLIAALVADLTCTAWGVGHVHYSIPIIPDLSLSVIGWSILTGVAFGIAAYCFARLTRFFGHQFRTRIRWAPLRPVVGGAILAIVLLSAGFTDYAGLGISFIQSAFTTEMHGYEFVLKILFTAFTLGAGFKGGEVTPLFFIGATLGNALTWFVPLPVALLAGMGFVAVFAGATNTPVACTIMGIELFGIEGGAFIAFACFFAYLSSGRSGIYGAQKLSWAKRAIHNSKLFGMEKDQRD